jgi:hypothetical protein
VRLTKLFAIATLVSGCSLLLGYDEPPTSTGADAGMSPSDVTVASDAGTPTDASSPRDASPDANALGCPQGSFCEDFDDDAGLLVTLRTVGAATASVSDKVSATPPRSLRLAMPSDLASSLALAELPPGLLTGAKGFTFSFAFRTPTAFPQTLQLVDVAIGSGSMTLYSNGTSLSVAGTFETEAGPEYFSSLDLRTSVVGFSVWHTIAIVFNHTTREIAIIADGVSTPTYTLPSRYVLMSPNQAIVHVGMDYVSGGVTMPFEFNLDHLVLTPIR